MTPMVAISFVAMASFVLAFRYLGFVPAMVLLCALLPPLWGERRFTLIASFAVLFPLLIWLIFVKLLKVYFPPGLLPFP